MGLPTAVRQALLDGRFELPQVRRLSDKERTVAQGGKDRKAFYPNAVSGLVQELLCPAFLFAPQDHGLDPTGYGASSGEE
jgi:hypothetical protein